MDPALPQIDDALRHWPDAAGALAERISSPQSFSASTVWKVTTPSGMRCLKRYHGLALSGPPVRDSDSLRNSLTRAHAFQTHLASVGPRLTPVLSLSRQGRTFVESRGCLWQLETWMPGAPDYPTAPSEDRVISAAKAVAAMHVAAAAFSGPDFRDATPGRQAPAHCFDRRLARCKALLTGELAERTSELALAPADARNELLREATRLVAPRLPQLADELARACQTPFAAGWTLGDVWHGNILFRGQDVTGLIDLGGARVDVQAADLVRLLGSLVRDDRSQWRAGMAAYESVRPLPLEELRAIDLLRRSEILLSAANWLQWLRPGKKHASNWGEKAWTRLAELVGRLRGLRRWD